MPQAAQAVSARGTDRRSGCANELPGRAARPRNALANLCARELRRLRRRVPACLLGAWSGGNRGFGAGRFAREAENGPDSASAVAGPARARSGRGVRAGRRGSSGAGSRIGRNQRFDPFHRRRHLASLIPAPGPAGVCRWRREHGAADEEDCARMVEGVSRDGARSVTARRHAAGGRRGGGARSPVPNF